MPVTSDPYATKDPGARTFYRTPASFMNGHRFRATVPFAYQPNMPACYKNGTGRNIVNYNDPNNNQTMNITIAMMIDMADKGFSFNLSNHEDIYLVFRTIDQYLVSIVPELKARKMPHILMAKKLCAFREDNFGVFQMAVLKNDGLMNEILEIYVGEENTAFDQIFLHTVNTEGMSKSDRVKLVFKKIRKPPIDLTLLDVVVDSPVKVLGDDASAFATKELDDVSEDYISDLFGKDMGG